MLVKGDKIKLVKPMGLFTNVGEVCDVINVEHGIITFQFGEGMHMGCMSDNEFEKYFEKYEEPKSLSVDVNFVEQIINESHINVTTVFDKCTVVACKLPSGFVIVESSACVDPKNYNKDMGVDICLSRIKDRICEMEAYRCHDELWDRKNFYCDAVDDCEDCKICANNGGYCTDCDDEDDCFEDYYDDECDCCGDCDICSRS